MNKGSFICLVTGLFVLLALHLPAQTVSVDYLEGYLEVRDGGSWREVYIGDVLDGDARVRLSDDGYAELSAGRAVITLAEGGEFVLSGYLQSTTGGQVDIRSLLGSRVGAFTRQAPRSTGTVGGVRGDIVEGESDEDFLMWAEEDDDALTRGNELYEIGEYAEALDIYREGAKWETGPLRDELEFRTALCLLNLGQPREARGIIEGLNPAPEDPYWGDYMVVAGTLMIESGDFAGALGLSGAYLTSPGDGSYTQEAYFLSALSRLGLGNTTGARKDLEACRDVDPGSDQAAAAEEMLAGL